MDTIQSPQAPNPTPEKKKFNGFLFLEVGLAGIVSVIFVLLVSLGVLNYFGILPISESFPFLSFLPQKQKAVTNNTIKINTSGNPLKSLTFNPRSSSI